MQFVEVLWQWSRKIRPPTLNSIIVYPKPIGSTMAPNRLVFPQYLVRSWNACEAPKVTLLPRVVLPAVTFCEKRKGDLDQSSVDFPNRYIRALIWRVKQEHERASAWCPCHFPGYVWQVKRKTRGDRWQATTPISESYNLKSVC
jgi:hypothetical protein